MQTRLYGYDALGNTRLLVNGGTGALLWQGAWGAWWAAQDTGGGACPTPFGYKGQTGAYYDMESGLLKMGARYYAPCIGRFLSRDPSGFSSGANLYAFCMGDPVNFFDPNGCEAINYNDAIWQGIGFADKFEKALGHYLPGAPTGIPHSLLDARDAMQHAGESAGNTCKSPHDTQVDAAYAALHFGNATIACVGPALMTVRALGEAEAAEEALGEGQRLIRVNKRAGGGGPRTQSAELLQKQSQEALADAEYGVHGVSVRTPESLSRSVQPYYGQATANQIRRHFPLIKTGPPGHYTVELPNPVTQEASDIFNRLFGFPTE